MTQKRGIKREKEGVNTPLHAQQEQEEIVAKSGSSTSSTHGTYAHTHLLYSFTNGVAAWRLFISPTIRRGPMLRI